MSIINLVRTVIYLMLVTTLHVGHAADSVEQQLALGDFDAAAVAATNAGTDHPVAQLIDAAGSRELWRDPMWHALLHYQQPRFSDGLESQIDAPHFFLSSEGKHDPRRELEATIAALHATTVKAPMRLIPACRFVARRQWLAASLADASVSFPPVACEEFDRYKTFLQADELTVIFPSAHPNSPSSAFGHTLLRLDRRDQAPELRMLNQSLNFAAEVPPDVGPMSYAVLGIGGGFKGRFHVLPYHLKLREYGQVDDRDIWEYTLNLTPEEVTWVLAHAYEMLIAYFDYYFFRENCSYHLLSLLDVVTPRQRLTEPFRTWAIPVDTIKALEQRGLIRERRFVASLGKKIKQAQRTLPEPEISSALTLWGNGGDTAAAGLSSFEPIAAARAMDLAGDLLRYRRLNGGGEVTRLTDAEKSILRQRSRIALATEEIPVPRPAVTPELGHGTSRVTIGMTNDRDRQLAVLQWRPAYHDFLDPSPGYGDNNTIEFFALAAGYERDRDQLFLREFTLLDIHSVEPRDRFFKPISWRTRIAWEKQHATDSTRATLLGGAGLAWREARSGILGYGFLESALVHDLDLDESLTVMGQLRGGALWEPIDGWRTRADLSVNRDLANRGTVWEFRWDNGIALGKRHALTLGATSTGAELGALKWTLETAVRTYF
ncbi:MAG: DUF4105 domain-containing protein [Thiotrichales bacterium]